jgi:cytochrome c-type biogenesis protein CcmH
VRINVTLAPSLAQSASGSSPLFVFVRDPQRPGPPLAVKRLDSHFPQTVELTALDSMLPGRAITAGQKVQVVARIARSGNPVGATGDPFGESAYMVGRDGLINIVIDRVTP